MEENDSKAHSERETQPVAQHERQEVELCGTRKKRENERQVKLFPAARLAQSFFTFRDLLPYLSSARLRSPSLSAL
jgi:hypothetical protein